MRVYIYTALIILYVISNFTSGMILHFSIGIMATIALILSFFYAKGLYLVSGIIFFMSGILLLIYNNAPWYTFLLHFEQMLGLLSLFLVLPFINSLIRFGRYDKNLNLLLQDQVTSLTKLYRRSYVVCHFLGLFLNIATLPLLTNSLKGALQKFPDKTQNKFYTQNLLRAYALCLTWSPMEVMVSTTIDITRVHYYKIFPILISLAILTICFDWILSAFKYKNTHLSIENQQKINSKKVYKKILQLLCMLLIFTLAASGLQHFLNKGFLFSVVLLIIPFSIIWTLCIGGVKRYFIITIPHWKKRTEGLSNYFFMFLSAGFFVEMLSLSGLLSFLKPVFSLASEKTLLFYLIIGAYFLVTSLIGFHPLISLTFLAELLQPILPIVDPIPLSIVLISCSLSTVMYSPYNLSVSILASQLTMNPFQLGRWNIGFAIFYMLLSICTAHILGYFL